MTLATFFTALVAAIKAVPILESWVQQFISIYMTAQTNETLSKISDAASFAARSKTDEDRFQASAKWATALARPREL